MNADMLFRRISSVTTLKHIICFYLCFLRQNSDLSNFYTLQRRFCKICHV